MLILSERILYQTSARVNMKVFFRINFFLIIVALTSTLSSAQNQKFECPEFQKKAGENSAGFYAVVRYVIVYNEYIDFLAEPERRFDVLMSPEQLNEENLKCVFTLINKQLPTPQRRSIRVHTSLATIQTPEELKLWQRSDDPRFSDLREKYKSASYFRFAGGREVFEFTMQLEPNYETKTVILVDKSAF